MDTFNTMEEVVASTEAIAYSGAGTNTGEALEFTATHLLKLSYKNCFNGFYNLAILGVSVDRAVSIMHDITGQRLYISQFFLGSHSVISVSKMSYIIVV